MHQFFWFHVIARAASDSYPNRRSERYRCSKLHCDAAVRVRPRGVDNTVQHTFWVAHHSSLARDYGEDDFAVIARAELGVQHARELTGLTETTRSTRDEGECARTERVDVRGVEDERV